MMCENENDCKRIQYAECSKNKKCVCKSNYVQSNPAKCALVLGRYCNNNNQCATDNSICFENKCKCKVNFVKRSNNQCIPSKYVLYNFFILFRRKMNNIYL